MDHFNDCGTAVGEKLFANLKNAYAATKFFHKVLSFFKGVDIECQDNLL